MTTSHAPFSYIGPALRMLRGRAGLTQGELAEIATITKSQVSKYEGGHQRPTLDTLDRITTALGVDVFGLALALREVEQALALRRADGDGLDGAARRRMLRSKARTEVVQGFSRYLELLEDAAEGGPE